MFEFGPLEVAEVIQGLQFYILIAIFASQNRHSFAIATFLVSSRFLDSNDRVKIFVGVSSTNVDVSSNPSIPDKV